MEIENNSKNYNIPITNIELGECFIYNGMLHMRVDNGSMNYRDVNTYPCTILNLETNCLNATRDNVFVKRIKAKIIVE